MGKMPALRVLAVTLTSVMTAVEDSDSVTPRSHIREWHFGGVHGSTPGDPEVGMAL